MIVLAAATPAVVHRLQLADLRRTVGVSDAQIAPDGKRVLVVVRRNDYQKDRAVADLVLVDVRTRAARALLHDAPGLGQVEWSPDGTRVAYTAQDAKKTPQVFVLPMNGGEPLQVTHDANGAESFDWRPDGRALAYTAQATPPNQAALKRHEDGFSVDDEAWTDQKAPVNTLLYQVSAGGGTAHRIGSGDWSVGGGFTYARDGRSIFVTRIGDHRNPNRYLSRAIVRIDVASGRMHALPALSRTQTDPLRARDGRIAFGFTNPHGIMQAEVALADANGNHPVWVTRRLDRDVGGAAFLPDGSLVVGANDRTQRRLFRVRPNGAVSALPIGSLGAGNASVASDGTIAFTANAPDRPSELFLLQPGARAPIRLTNYNAWLGRFHLGATRPVVWRTFDGMTADGVVTAPPGPHPSRAPLVVYIHGGPTDASTTAYSGFVQVLAAHGWFVFQPNYRGSDNLGVAYARTTVPHITSVPGRDIEAGLAQVLRQYPIDRTRIGVSGWSEGGLMTSWLITQDHRWAAAVSGAAVNDWVQYDAMSDSKDFSPMFIGRSPWSSPAQYRLYEAESPLSYASAVRTPTLIMSDAGDYRVPTPLAYEFYHEVRATGTPVQFVVYPVVGHFPRDPVRVEDILRRWESWLAKYLGSS